MNLKQFFDVNPDITQAAMGDGCGVSESTVRSWITGERLPKVPNVEKIVRFTDGRVTYSDLRPDIWPVPVERSIHRGSKTKVHLARRNAQAPACRSYADTDRQRPVAPVVKRTLSLIEFNAHPPAKRCAMCDRISRGLPARGRGC